MTERLSWYFELVDRMSGPADRIASSLEQTQGAAQQVSQSIDRFEETMKSVTTVLERVEDSMKKTSASTEKVATSMRKVTGATDKTGEALKRTAGATKASTKAAASLGDEFTSSVSRGWSVNALVGDIGAGLGGWATLAVTVKNALFGVFDAAVRLGTGTVSMLAAGGKFALDALQFRESTLSSLKVMLGTEESAQRIFDQASKLANSTPLAMADVLGGYKKLLAAGFSETEVPVVFQAVGDAAAFNDFNAGVIDSLSRAFGQIKGKARLQAEELNQVLEAGGGAVRRADVFANIASQLGIAVSQVDKAIQGGRVSDDVGIFAILKALEKAGGGAVGGMMREQGKTLTGLLSTLTDAPRAFFLSMDQSNLPGFTAIKGAVSNLIGLMDTSSETGKRLMATLDRVFNQLFGDLFGGFAGAAGMARLESLVGDVVKGVETAWTVLRGIGAGLSAFFSTAWAGMQPLAEFLLGPSFSSGERGAAQFARTMTALGTAVGTVAAALANLLAMPSAIAQVALTPSAWLSAQGDKLLGLGSFGGGGDVDELPDGIPAMAEGGIVSRPTLALIGEAGPEAVVPLSRGRGRGGTSVTINVSVSVDARGQDGEGIAHQLGLVLPRVLADALEGLALEGGVS